MTDAFAIGIIWFNIITSTYLIALAFVAASLFLVARASTKNTRLIVNALTRVGENIGTIAPELRKTEMKFQESTDALTKGMSEVKIAFTTHASDLHNGTSELKEEIRHNRDAIRGFDNSFKRVYWWMR